MPKFEYDDNDEYEMTNYEIVQTAPSQNELDIKMVFSELNEERLF